MLQGRVLWGQGRLRRQRGAAGCAGAAGPAAAGATCCAEGGASGRSRGVHGRRRHARVWRTRVLPNGRHGSGRGRCVRHDGHGSGVWDAAGAAAPASTGRPAARTARVVSPAVAAVLLTHAAPSAPSPWGCTAHGPAVRHLPAVFHSSSCRVASPSAAPGGPPAVRRPGGRGNRRRLRRQRRPRSRIPAVPLLPPGCTRLPPAPRLRSRRAPRRRVATCRGLRAPAALCVCMQAGSRPVHAGVACHQQQRVPQPRAALEQRAALASVAAVGLQRRRRLTRRRHRLPRRHRRHRRRRARLSGRRRARRHTASRRLAASARPSVTAAAVGAVLLLLPHRDGRLGCRQRRDEAGVGGT